MNKDYSGYILPVGVLVIAYLVLSRFGIIKSGAAEQKEEEQLFKNYFSPLYVSQLISQGGRTALFTQTDAANIANGIYNAKGIFNDNETALYGLIKKFKYKSQVSQVADKFQKTYGKDLAFYLNSFLSESELQRVYNYTDQLPTGKL